MPGAASTRNSATEARMFISKYFMLLEGGLQMIDGLTLEQEAPTDANAPISLTSPQRSLQFAPSVAGIAQLVERNLAKVQVASSSLVSRSILE